MSKSTAVISLVVQRRTGSYAGGQAGDPPPPSGNFDPETESTRVAFGALSLTHW